MIKIISSSSGSSTYEVDTDKVTCTCAHFKYRCSHYTIDNDNRLCKHLSKVYLDNPELKPAVLSRKDNASDQVTDPDGKLRFPREIFDPYVSEIRQVISNFKEIKKSMVCGSYRRLASRVSDLDILIVLEDGKSWDRFLNYLEDVMGYTLIQEIGRGDKKAAYMINGFIHVDFKNIPEESWAYATMHFTGSKMENIEMRRRANSMGYKLNEYGLMNESTGEMVSGLTTEEDIYKYLNMPYKEPWNRT